LLIVMIIPVMFAEIRRGGGGIYTALIISLPKTAHQTLVV